MEFTYIDDPAALTATIAEITGAGVLGVDTEAAGYHRYHDRISLIQLSTRDRNAIVDPLAIPDLSALAPILEDPEVEKIFHDADFDLRIMHRDLGLTIRNLFDTQIAAAFLGERALGLGAIVEKYLGISLPKAYQRADWAERPLRIEMLEYAATDTAYLPDLRDRLLERLRSIGREHWAREEFVRREGTRWDPVDNSEAFLRVKGARDLSPRGLAILREVFRWRESVGAERDQATFRILSNQAMIELGLKAPTTRRELREIGGLSSGLIERRGNDILAAVERGLAVPEGELPRFPPARRWERDPEADERADRLREVRNAQAEALQLDAGFLMARALLEEIARRNPTTLEELAALPDVRAWQVEAIGTELLGALRG